MRRVTTRVLIESVRLVFAILVGWGCAYALQGPIESTCGPNPVGGENPTGICAGTSALLGAVLGFVAAIILSVFAQAIWRRRRAGRSAKSS